MNRTSLFFGLTLGAAACFVVGHAQGQDDQRQRPVPDCQATFEPGTNADVFDASAWTAGVANAQTPSCAAGPNAVQPRAPLTTSAVEQNNENKSSPTRVRVIGGKWVLPFEGPREVDDNFGAVAAGESFAIINPPPPTTIGACCTGAECQITDFFDCREAGGYFQPNVVQCFPETCVPGVCCVGDPVVCNDDNGLGELYTPSVCDQQGGIYVGGAAGCDKTDPCQRLRIPEGFELVELAPQLESFAKREPRMNVCGEIVFHVSLPGDGPIGLTNDIFYYDNGTLKQITDSPDKGHVFPDINDGGVIVWSTPMVSPGTDIVMLRDGVMFALAPVESSFGQQGPRLNLPDHVVWKQQIAEPCPDPVRHAIYFYDGHSAFLFFNDGLSNQSPVINDRGEIVWTRYTFPCDGGFGDWTSEKMLFSGGVVQVLPSNQTTPQSGDINNLSHVAWANFDFVELWKDGQTDTFTEGHIPSLNDRGEVAFQRYPLPWHLWLHRDEVEYLISDPVEGLGPPWIDNGRAELNNYGEIAWVWRPNSPW